MKEKEFSYKEFEVGIRTMTTEDLDKEAAVHKVTPGSEDLQKIIEKRSDIVTSILEHGQKEYYQIVSKDLLEGITKKQLKELWIQIRTLRIYTSVDDKYISQAKNKELV